MPLVPTTWLLRTTRLAAPDPDLRVAARFAAAGGGVGAVHPSQVTRWESGATPVSWDVVRRYERRCAVPPGRLVAAIDLVHRDEQPRGLRPRLRRPASPDPVAELEPLLERVLGDDVLTGHDWDRLTTLVGEIPDVLVRRRDWTVLLGRGLEELTVTTGMPYLQRAEALARLCGHPRAALAAHELVRDVLTDPGGQVFGEAAALLRVLDLDESAELLRSVIREPVGAAALRGALTAASARLRAPMVPTEVAADIVQMSAARYRDADQPYLVRRAAADVLLTLPDRLRQRLDGRVPALDHLRRADGGAPMTEDGRRAVQARVVDRLAGYLGPQALEDRPFTSLVQAVTAGSDDVRRAHAMQLLMLLPQGRPVGQALLGELESAVVADDPVRMQETLALLVCLAPADDLHLLLDLATRTAPVAAGGDQVAVSACWAVGNAKFAHPDLDLVRKRLTSARDAAVSGERPASPGLLRAWAYALGRRQLLDDEPATPDDAGPDADAAARWRQASGWWTGLPHHVRAAAAEL